MQPHNTQNEFKIHAQCGAEDVAIQTHLKILKNEDVQQQHKTKHIPNLYKLLMIVWKNNLQSTNYVC